MRTKRKNYFCVLIILLVLIEITSIFLMYKSSNNRETLLDNVNLKEEIKNMKGIAIMLQQSDGTYKESDTNTFPTDMTFNATKSGCIDNLGNKIDGAITYTNGVVNVTTSNTTYCYLYFDEKEILYDICSSYNNIDECSKNEGLSEAKDIWKSTLEDDGYRFVGTNPDNYICFGTTDQNECKNDTDKYMYRIIGIFEDSEGKQHLKLIKKEALNTSYAWHSDKAIDTDWDESDLYKGINENYFLTNTDYSYMQDSNWTNKISTWNYTATNTKTKESSGPNYSSETVTNVYLHEMNRSGKTSSVGEWKTVSAKIGLMYVSDYFLSLGSSALNYTNNSNSSTLKTGWMHISNNDSTSLSTTSSAPPSSHEWTMSRQGIYYSSYFVWDVYSFGNVDNRYVDNSYSVRPVFYLTSDTQLSEGTGTSDDPYIIYQQSASDNLIENVSSDVLWESTLEDDGYRYVGTDPSNYICFGTTDTSTCTGNTDLYMYRIIGIFEDSSEEKHLKLIKKEALNTAYEWHSDISTDADWDASDLYNGINGSYFLSNTTYSYMQDTNWTNKIATWEYTATNTLTYENYSANSVYGPNYYYQVIRTTYLHEMNRSSKANCYYNASTTADCSVGEWKTVSAKIGLMYVSDYQLSLGETALDYTNSNSTHYASMKTGWMHISNNDSASLSTTAVAPPLSYEWTMSRCGDDYGTYDAWLVYSTGVVSDRGAITAYSVRPVFYLISDVTISGEGTSTNPFIIS